MLVLLVYGCLLSLKLLAVFLGMVLKTEPDIKRFFFLISGSTPVFARFLTGFEGFNRTRLTPGSQLNRPVRSGF